MSHDVAPKGMMGAANGHCSAKTCTWAITSCLVFFFFFHSFWYVDSRYIALQFLQLFFIDIQAEFL